MTPRPRPPCARARRMRLPTCSTPTATGYSGTAGACFATVISRKSRSGTRWRPRRRISAALRTRNRSAPGFTRWPAPNAGGAGRRRRRRPTSRPRGPASTTRTPGCWPGTRPWPWTRTTSRRWSCRAGTRLTWDWSSACRGRRPTRCWSGPGGTWPGRWARRSSSAGATTARTARGCCAAGTGPCRPNCASACSRTRRAVRVPRPARPACRGGSARAGGRPGDPGGPSRQASPAAGGRPAARRGGRGGHRRGDHRVGRPDRGRRRPGRGPPGRSRGRAVRVPCRTAVGPGGRGRSARRGGTGRPSRSVGAGVVASPGAALAGQRRPGDDHRRDQALPARRAAGRPRPARVLAGLRRPVPVAGNDHGVAGQPRPHPGRDGPDLGDRGRRPGKLDGAHVLVSAHPEQVLGDAAGRAERHAHGHRLRGRRKGRGRRLRRGGRVADADGRGELGAPPGPVEPAVRHLAVAVSLAVSLAVVAVSLAVSLAVVVRICLVVVVRVILVTRAVVVRICLVVVVRVSLGAGFVINRLVGAAS